MTGEELKTALKRVDELTEKEARDALKGAIILCGLLMKLPEGKKP